MDTVKALRIFRACSAIACICAVWCVTAVAALAQQQQAVPPGMEVIKVGDTLVLIPRGTKVTRRGAQLVLEPIDEYTARRLNDMDISLAQLRTQTEELRKQVEVLTQTLEKLQKDREGQSPAQAAGRKNAAGVGERP